MRQNEKRGIGVDGGAALRPVETRGCAIYRRGRRDAGQGVKRGRRGGAAIARAGDVDVDGGAVRAEMDAGGGEADEGGGAGDAGEAGERGEDLRSGGTARRNNSRR
jgi:hypothetical protein